RLEQASTRELTAFAARVTSLMTDVPELPNFSRFHDVFRDNPRGASNEGHVRPAFFMAYDEAHCEFVRLGSKEIDERLKHGPELGIGYYAGRFTFRGIGLGAVTSTLLAAVLIGQLGITISPNVKSVFFLMFLFAVGYGVGPQFVRGIAKDGLPQALFAAVVCVFCLGACLLATKLVGYDLGYAAGLYAGSQTISASMGLATDAINRLGLAADQAKGLLDAMPVAYAVTYIFGTVGSAILLALLGPRLLGIDLVAACKAYEERQGGGQAQGGAGSAWHRWELRAFRVQPSGKVVGLRAVEAEALLPDARVFVLRLRRNGRIEDATADTVLRVDDVIAVAGAREVLVRVIGD